MDRADLILELEQADRGRRDLTVDEKPGIMADAAAELRKLDGVLDAIWDITRDRTLAPHQKLSAIANWIRHERDVDAD